MRDRRATGRHQPVRTTADKAERIKQLYYKTTRQTIGRDFALAVELARSMDSDEERGRVAVYMDGLRQMRSEWTRSQRRHAKKP